MARVGSDAYDECLKHEYAWEMDFTGKAMRGMIYISPEELESDDELAHWIGACEDFINTLPPKKRE